MNACGRGEKVKRDPLYLKIYNDLLAGIKNGTYASGSRLPSEKELSSNYDVSRITSKKALEMLAEQNMITRMPGAGLLYDAAVYLRKRGGGGESY